MWAQVVPVALVGVGLGIGPAPATPTDDFVRITKLAQVAKGRLVTARIAFHKPTLKRPGRDRLHVWIGAQEGSEVTTLWRSARVKVNADGTRRVAVSLPRKKAFMARTADRLLMTATQRHRAPSADLFATNYVATASVRPEAGRLTRGMCSGRVAGPGADLSGCDFTGAVLRSADLSGANLSNARLRESDLRQANLTGTILTYNLSVAQAINPKLDVQDDYGYVNFVSWTSNGQTTQLPLNLTGYNLASRQTLRTAGALQTVAVGPAILVDAALKSSPELDALSKLPAGATVTFGLTIYRWDSATKSYFPALYSGPDGLHGTLKSSPVWAASPIFGPPVDALMEMMILPGPGCGAYALQSRPGSATTVKWGQGC
jgi:hypothetical protein